MNNMSSSVNARQIYVRKYISPNILFLNNQYLLSFLAVEKTMSKTRKLINKWLYFNNVFSKRLYFYTFSMLPSFILILYSRKLKKPLTLHNITQNKAFCASCNILDRCGYTTCLEIAIASPVTRQGG